MTKCWSEHKQGIRQQVRKLMYRVVYVRERCDNPTVGVHESKKVLPVEGGPEDMLLLVGMSLEVLAPVVWWCVAIMQGGGRAQDKGKVNVSVGYPVRLCTAAVRVHVYS